MDSESRSFPRTDRPGSGIYRGGEPAGLAFDDYRSADEQKARRHPGKGFWQGLLNMVKVWFPLREEKLLEKAHAALARDPTLETDRILLSVERGELKASGSVSSRWMREQVADCLLKIPGVASLRNELALRPRRAPLPQEGPLAI
jgi:hypothetical protein